MATPQTNFRLASVSKQFTAVAILLLTQDGKLGLDDRLRHWLPSLPDATRPITIQHLLTHSSGLVDYEDLMDQDQTWQLRDQDVLHLLEGENRLYFAAGSGYRYSNGGYALLALIVEKASGKTFQQFLRERIFLPLGMHNSQAHVAEGMEIAHRVYGYSEIDGAWQRTDQSLTSSVLGDGAVYSSVVDLAKWDAALHGTKLLRASLLKQAFTPATPTDKPGRSYGFGWYIGKYRGLKQIWHSGASIGFRTRIVRYPEKKFTVIILANRADAKLEEFPGKIVDLVLFSTRQ